MNTNLEFSHKNQTMTVPRSTLFPEGDHFTPDGEMLAQLEELLKVKFDFGLLQTRRQKKRAHFVGGRPESIEKFENAPFRLLSTAHPPKAISLEARPVHTRTVWEPPLEDTGHEAELRRQQALSVAVDVPSILGSAQGYNTQRTGKVICASSDALPLSLAFFLAEFPPKGHRPSKTLHDREIRPSPHEVVIKGDGVPVISLRWQLDGNEQPAVRVRRKRRRRKSQHCTPQMQLHVAGMLTS
ncbi:hypothetical protein BJY52DRAFT_1254664 [Lactarius psammicola]|nr:hypothetical protein BJY52DRAFT_1254664 [Lactarius psammicola]